MNYARNEAKQWVRENLRGYMMTTTTPMTSGGEVDLEGLRANVEQMLAMPVTGGFYVGSIYQEFWTLTDAERRDIVATVVRTVDGRVPVIAGVSDTSVRDVISHAKHAEEVGADLIMVWPPFYGVRTDVGVTKFYEQVASAVDIGMCIYSTTLPELGFYVHADLVARLAEIDTVCAVKEASLSLSLFSATMMAAGDLLAVSCPIEEYQFYGAATFGFDVVPAFLLGNSRPLYAAAPCQRFASAMEGENLAEAAVALREILAVSNSLHSRYLTDGKHNVALTKYLTSLVGMAAGPVRPPLTDAPEEQKAEARGVLIAAGLLSDADPADPAAAPASTSGR